MCVVGVYLSFFPCVFRASESSRLSFILPGIEAMKAVANPTTNVARSTSTSGASKDHLRKETIVDCEFWTEKITAIKARMMAIRNEMPISPFLRRFF